MVSRIRTGGEEGGRTCCARARLLIESGAYSIYSPMMGRVLIYTAM